MVFRTFISLPSKNFSSWFSLLCFLELCIFSLGSLLSGLFYTDSVQPLLEVLCTLFIFQRVNFEASFWDRDPSPGSYNLTLRANKMGFFFFCRTIINFQYKDSRLNTLVVTSSSLNIWYDNYICLVGNIVKYLLIYNFYCISVLFIETSREEICSVVQCFQYNYYDQKPIVQQTF